MIAQNMCETKSQGTKGVIFQFKPYGVRQTKPTKEMERIDYIPMNVRYMCDPVTVGDMEVIVEVTTTDCINDEKAYINIYETRADGLCTGNGERMVNAGLWRRPTEGEAVGCGYRIGTMPAYRPADIAEAVQRLYPEVPAVSIFEGITGEWIYSDMYYRD